MIVRNLYLLIEDAIISLPSDHPTQEKLKKLYKSTDTAAFQCLIEDSKHLAATNEWLRRDLHKLEIAKSSWEIQYYKLLMRLKNMEIKQLKTKEKK